MYQKKDTEANLDVALVPLANGRRVMVPLQVLAEVQLLSQPEGDGEGAHAPLEWRGHQLPVESLDVLCGLPQPPVELLTTVGVFKAAADSGTPFRALAFCGNAGQKRVTAEILEESDESAPELFVGATIVDGETCLIPDLPRLLFAA